MLTRPVDLDRMTRWSSTPNSLAGLSRIITSPSGVSATHRSPSRRNDDYMPAAHSGKFSGPLAKA